MLKKFFLNALSSFIGAWIAIVIFGGVSVLVCFSLLAKLGTSQIKESQVTKDSILKIEGTKNMHKGKKMLISI